jgi:hypothetical protein
MLDELKRLIETGALDAAIAAAVARVNKPRPAATNPQPWPPAPPWDTVTPDNLAESEARLAELDAERTALSRRYRSDPQKQTLTIVEENRLHDLIKYVDLLDREIKAIRRLASAA